MVQNVSQHFTSKNNLKKFLSPYPQSINSKNSQKELILYNLFTYFNKIFFTLVMLIKINSEKIL